MSATGIGLLRIAWAATCLLFFLGLRADVTAFYSDAGFLPRDLLPLAVRAHWRFGLLDGVGDPAAALFLYWLLVGFLAACLLGVLPRLATIGSFVLLLAFHERNPHVLTGGDTLLRSLGFLLCIAPGIRAFSVSRLAERVRLWREERAVPAPIAIPAWPSLLVLWQLVLLYACSLWLKAQGTAWTDGTAAGIVLHHPAFARWPALAPLLAPLSPLLTRFDLLVHAAWLCVLIPSRVWKRLLPMLPTPKQTALLLGTAFHLGIWALLTVGDFPLAVLAAYLGTLRQDDFDALRRITDLLSPRRGPVAVLYDGRCGLCTRTIAILAACDWLRRLRLADFRVDAERRAYAPDVPYESLEREMYVRTAAGATFAGFDAFRALCWHLPPLWPLGPLLYAPGVAAVGRRVYRWVADRRRACEHPRVRKNAEI